MNSNAGHEQHFQRFKRALESGKRAEAKAALDLFIASFASLEEKSVWSKAYLEGESRGHKMRHEIYAQVIFPVLLDGYRRGDPWSLLWLARTVQNLYQSEPLWKQLDMKTDYVLLKELLALCPDDEEARLELLSRQMEWFHYCLHEWPAGILHGRDGATLAECGEIAEEIDCARKLDRERLHAGFLGEFERRLLEYRQRLSPVPADTPTPQPDSDFAPNLRTSENAH